MVSIETNIPRSKLFRFESYWILHPGFMDVVQQVWAKPVLNKNVAAMLSHKFKALCHALKIWSKHISRLSIAITNCNEVLAELDELENKCCLNLPDANFRNILKAHLLKLLKYLKLYWKKRCTIRWIKFGDENTKFFQAIATERFRKNNIASFRAEDGSLVEDHPGKEALLHSTYKSKLGTTASCDMKFDLPRIIRKCEGLEALTVPFSNEEIDAVIKETSRQPVHPHGLVMFEITLNNNFLNIGQM